MFKSEQWKNELRRLFAPPTTTQNGGENSIEYCQLKAATLAGECQEVFVATVFTLHAGEAVVQIAAIEIAINLLVMGS
jgi:3-deoxy-D-manno-octulosonic-acid transferase